MILATDWLAFQADRTPERLASIDQHTGRRVSYGDMHERTGRLAAWLRDAWGVQPGDRIAILGKNSVAYFEFEFACIKLGAMMLPLNWRLAEPELLFILNDAEARGIVYDSEFAARIPPLVAGSTARHTLRLDIDGFPADDGAPEFEQVIAAEPGFVTMNPYTTLDDPMTIMYTAGTTGHPKGVLITHQMTLYNAINISNPTGLNHDSVFYSVLPTFHTGGLNLYANPMFYLGGVAIIPREFDAARTLTSLADPELGVTHFFGVPSIYLFLSQEPGFEAADLSRIHSWGCGGAPMPVPLLQKYAARGIIIQLGFGMTETSPTVFLIDKRRSLEKPSSVGKPMMYARVRVVTEAFADVAPGEIGEVVLSGPNITPGYWKRPDANASSFTTDEHGIRWLHSGDAGTVDDEGCIYIVDRYKDMYISGGENVYPAEVEQVLFQLPEVADAAIIGVPDERWGECGLAILVLKQGITLEPERVIAHCRTQLAKYKVPRSVVFIDALPRNAAGKVLKRDLRARFIPSASS
ncbi:MAG TPA: long-chain fatty acid--CoA ligase [Candidatus Limnocylindrales bacterium]|nr:long-chain fatty acid--CoA ligase [Candidatus Limnocylindrales bacterium]